MDLMLGQWHIAITFHPHSALDTEKHNTERRTRGQGAGLLENAPVTPSIFPYKTPHLSCNSVPCAHIVGPQQLK